MKALTLFCDGAATGNPLGPAGCGAVLYDADGTEVAAVGRYLGTATNNEAEYHGLLLGLERAAALGVTRLSIRADSELMIRQLTGVYRVRAAHLRPLYERAVAALRGVPQWDAKHVRRELNGRADGLANEAIDEALRGREKS